MMSISTRPILRLLLVAVLLALAGAVRACDPPRGSVDVGRRPPDLSERYPYIDGIEVQVTEVWAGHQWGVPVVELTVTITNGTMHTFEAWIRGDLRCGPYRIPVVRYVRPPGPDDRGSVQVIASGGTSNPYRMAFVMPPGGRDEVMFSVEIDAGSHDPAVFVGSLRS